MAYIIAGLIIAIMLGVTAMVFIVVALRDVMSHID